MDSTRIKIKIGEHEFEAEGPAKVVQEQFEAFKQLISKPPEKAATPSESVVEQAGIRRRNAEGEIPLDKIYRVEKRVVSLTVKPESEATAAMLIMLGQKAYRENETVTASEIRDGLEQSGYRPDRVDRIMQPLSDEGNVVRIGIKKGTRYRFTNQGLSKAEAAAREAIAQVY
jgi:hypothetical protein